jgi:hypothetical protein
MEPSRILYRGNLRLDRPVDLGRIYPLGNLSGQNLKNLEGSLDGQKFFPLTAGLLHDISVRFLRGEGTRVTLTLGHGFYASENPEMTGKFISRHGWGGADGIYSFNLEDGKDFYGNQKKKTLFVFGDTFAGEVSRQGRRIEPTAMVNSSLAYYQNGRISFVLHQGEKGQYKSIFEVPDEVKNDGYLPKNLVDYVQDGPDHKGYLCSQNPAGEVHLTFDLFGRHPLTGVSFENFHDSNPEIDYSSRGLRELQIDFSCDGKTYRNGRTLNLRPYGELNRSEYFKLAEEARYVRVTFKPGKQFKPLTAKDKMAGLSKVRFYGDQGEQYFDVACASDSIFFSEPKKKWFWLQDGVVYNDNFYIFPVVVEDDLSGPEGYQFKISGTCMIKCQIKDGKLDYLHPVSRQVPLYNLIGGKEYILPSAIYYNNGPDEKADGYVYFYGYFNNPALYYRQMIVARIKPDDLDDLNNLLYFDGQNWVRDLSKAQPILKRVSTEMSVQPLTEGYYKGKYLAVFDYDTNTPVLAYAIGDSLTGPFSEPRVFYITPEPTKFNKETYTYNAKTHLHLSTEDQILVSYNCNDMIMAHNKANFDLYHPRFLTLKETSKDD